MEPKQPDDSSERLSATRPLVQAAVQNGFRLRGVELMSYLGVTSAAHDDRDVAETVAAFDDLVSELDGTVLARV